MNEKKSIIIPKQGECVVAKFLKKDVRKTFHNNEWWFSTVDIIGVLSESDNPRRYWSDLKNKMEKEEGFQLYDFIVQLKLPSKDGKLYETDCTNIEGILRVVQSVPSKNAEPFKKWLAKVGFDRIQEQQNPDLTVKRAILYYELQGRDREWIQNRIDGQFTRNELTGEWKQRGVQEGQEYATLTNIISQETFGVSVSKHKEIKGLKKENLRDNMTNIELIFQRLGEQATIDIARNRDVIGFDQNKKAARDGGASAGEARKAYENRIGSKVVTNDNFLKNKNQLKLINVDNNQLNEINTEEIKENHNFEKKPKPKSNPQSKPMIDKVIQDNKDINEGNDFQDNLKKFVPKG
jgi:DNA-damage-inducible protein D